MCSPKDYVARVYPKGLDVLIVCQTGDGSACDQAGVAGLALGRGWYLGNLIPRVVLRPRSEA